MTVTTSQDMYKSTLYEVNKSQTGGIPVPEWEELINSSQEAVITDRYMAYVQGDEKRVADLGALTSPFTEIIPTAANEFDFENPAVSTGGKLVDYAPAVDGRFGFWYMLSAGVKFNYLGNECFPDGIGAAFIGMKPMKSDRYFALKRDKYNRPTDERPYYDVTGGNGKQKVLRVINDTQSTANRCLIQFLMYPRTIKIALNGVNDIDIPVHLRKEVVLHAVRKHLERIESQRSGTVLRDQKQDLQ